MKSKLLVFTALIVTALWPTSVVQADLINTTNIDDFTSSLIPAGTDLTAVSTNNTPDIYLEATGQSGSVLINDLDASGALLPTATLTTPSTLFDVYYVHFFPDSATEIIGTFSFDQPIIGVAGTNGFGTSDIAPGSDVVLGDSTSTAFQVAGVIYDDQRAINGIQEDANDNYTVAGNTIIFSPAQAGTAGADNYRIYVQAVPDGQAVPEPCSATLMGLGALALFARRKR